MRGVTLKRRVLFAALAALACFTVYRIWLHVTGLQLYSSPPLIVDGKAFVVRVLQPFGWQPSITGKDGIYEIEINEDPARRGIPEVMFPSGEHREPGYILIHVPGSGKVGEGRDRPDGAYRN